MPKKNRYGINVIPNNMEKYMAFMLRKQLVFIDSFQFMAQSLENQRAIYLLKHSNIHQTCLEMSNCC